MPPSLFPVILSEAKINVHMSGAKATHTVFLNLILPSEMSGTGDKAAAKRRGSVQQRHGTHGQCAVSTAGARHAFHTSACER